jgi:Kef-type K+ transport system membrane component KefB
MVFSPVFFASIGIKATFNGLSLSVLAFGICFVLVGILGKIVGCYLASRWMKKPRLESFIIGIGMIARGEVALIVMNKGISSGLMTSDFLATGVLLVLTSSLLAPLLLRLTYKKIDKAELNKSNPSTQPLI